MSEFENSLKNEKENAFETLRFYPVILTKNCVSNLCLMHDFCSCL